MKTLNPLKQINSHGLSIAPPAIETSHLQLPSPPPNVATKISQRRRDRDVRFGGVFVKNKTQSLADVSIPHWKLQKLSFTAHSY
jgi:hypothetical protein